MSTRSSFRAVLVAELSFILLFVAVPCFGQVFVFVDVTSQAGIVPTHNAGGGAGEGPGVGAAVADYDGDGWLDIYIPQGPGSHDRLYRNKMGDSGFNPSMPWFEDVAEASGLTVEPPEDEPDRRAGLWIDYDNDGDLDLFTMANPVGLEDSMDVCGSLGLKKVFRLYEQDDNGVFTEVDDAGFPCLGIVGANHTYIGSINAGDFNNDGWVDIYAAFFQQSYLFENKGPNHLPTKFEDVSDSSGATVGSLNWQAIIADFDDDGWLDIFQTVDLGGGSQLFINQHTRTPTFVDGAGAAGMSTPGIPYDMGATLGDYNNDGLVDLYVVNASGCGLPQSNHLFRNNGDGTYTDEAVAVGLGETGWSYGATFFDADNDGDVDVAVAVSNSNFPGCVRERRFFWNQGGSFSHEGNAFAEGAADDGSTIIAFDYDRDGDLDLLHMGKNEITNPIRLYENTYAGDNKYFVVVPRGTTTDRYSIGATVRLKTANHESAQVITAGTSFLGQEPYEAHFGLGTDTSIVSITVTWLNGNTWSCPEDEPCPEVSETGSENRLVVIRPPGGRVIYLQEPGPLPGGMN